MYFNRQTGLVGHWKFNEKTGLIANDSSRYKNNGTLSGTNLPKWENNILRFDGTNNYVNCGNNISLKPLQLTVQCWVDNTRTTNTTWDQIIVTSGANSQPAFGYVLTWGWGSDFYFRVGNGVTYVNLISTSISKIKWHCIVATFKNGEQKLYVDNIIVGINNLPSNIPYDTSNITFGLSQFIGLISDIKIYNRALSANEISDYYESTKHKYI